MHLQLIGYALLAYQRIIKLSRRESTQDAASLLAINTLRQRIAALKAPSEGEQPFLIDFDELVTILSALTALIDSVSILLPPSIERNAREAILASNTVGTAGRANDISILLEEHRGLSGSQIQQINEIKGIWILWCFGERTMQSLKGAPMDSMVFV